MCFFKDPPKMEMEVSEWNQQKWVFAIVRFADQRLIEGGSLSKRVILNNPFLNVFKKREKNMKVQKKCMKIEKIGNSDDVFKMINIAEPWHSPVLFTPLLCDSYLLEASAKIHNTFISCNWNHQRKTKGEVQP